MEQKINEIKMIFQAAGIDKLPECIPEIQEAGYRH